MVWQILLQEQRPDGLYVAAKFWASLADREAGKPAPLFNDFRFPSLETTHQRIRTGPLGGLLHASGAEVDPAEVREFLQAEGIRWARDASGQPVRDRRGRWRPDKSGQPRARAGISLAPFTLNRPRPQEFDPQWIRESFATSIAADIAATLDAYERRAAERGWCGDRRGTSTVLQVASTGDDGYTTIAFATPTGFAPSSSSVRSGGTVDSSDEKYHAWYFFGGLSAVSGTVNAAVLSLYGITTPLVGSPYTKLKVENNNAATPPSDAYDHESRTRHANYVQWNSPALSNSAFVDSPDISTLVQPIVDLGEAATILILNDGEQTDFGYYQAYAYDLDSSKAAKLTIDHGAAGGSGPGGQPSLLRSPNHARRPIYRR